MDFHPKHFKKIVIFAQLNGECSSSNCLGTVEDSRCDDVGRLLVWSGFCLLCWFGVFVTRSSKKIQETTRRAIDFSLRLETSRDLSYWHKTDVFAGIKRKDAVLGNSCCKVWVANLANC